jgi:hypothetical protein
LYDSSCPSTKFGSGVSGSLKREKYFFGRDINIVRLRCALLNYENVSGLIRYPAILFSHFVSIDLRRANDHPICNQIIKQ